MPRRSVRQQVSRVSHKAGGGHPSRGAKPSQNASAFAKINRKIWDHWDPDEENGGGQVEFQEYPKHVYPWGMDGENRKRFVEVASREEEEAAMASGNVVREEDTRARLLAIGEVKGLKLDRRWGIDKLEAAITAAGHDPALDPSR